LSAPVALDVLDVSKRFGAHWALARVSFQLPRGGALLLTGHNGSGKTTLLRLIATALRPSSGRLTVLGLDAATAQEEIRARVGLLSHAHFVYDDLAGLENLEVLARLLGRPRGSARDALSRVGLDPRDDRPVRFYSAGMRKRLALARLFLKAPELALLDEPFGELDPEGIADVERAVKELRAAGTTLVLATHQIQQGLSLCDQRLHLETGRSVAA
jgi:heme exporter protein A